MSKITYTKLKASLNNNIETTIINFNDMELEVKSYLPIEEKIKILENIISTTEFNMSYCNWLEVYTSLDFEIIKAYTNITFTDKQSEDYIKVIDLFYKNGLMAQIKGAIPITELHNLEYILRDVITSCYQHQHSALGVMENLSTDYSNLGNNVEDLVDKLKNAENLDVVMDVVKKLG